MTTSLLLPAMAPDHASAFVSTTDFDRPTWTRRSFLGALSAVALGSVAGCGVLGADQQDISGGGTAPAGRGGGLGSGSGPGRAPTPPFALGATFELSEDYFTITNHPIDPTKDTVVAYSRADGEVEAMILQGGIVKQAYRDSTQPGGWNEQPLPDAVNVTAMVAGVSGPIPLGSKSTAAVLKVFYVRSDVKDTLFVAVETPPSGPGAAPTYTTSHVPWSNEAHQLQIAVNFDNSLLVTAINFVLPGPTGVLHYYADGLTVDHTIDQPPSPAYGSLTGFSFKGTGGGDFSYVGGTNSAGWSAVVSYPNLGANQPTLTLCLPHGSYQPITIGTESVNPPSALLWEFPLRSGPHDDVGFMKVDVDFPPASPTNSVAYNVECATTLGSRSRPSLLVRTIEASSYAQKLWMVSPRDPNSWTWTEMTLPAAADKTVPMAFSLATRPMPAGEKPDPNGGQSQSSFADVFVVTKTTLGVIHQVAQGDAAKDYNSPTYAPAIPLQPGVTLMTGQAGQSTGNELLVVGTDGNLQTLQQDPLTQHWTDAAVQLPASELQQASAYRTVLSVADSWNLPVAGQELSITASTPVTVLTNGRTVTLGADPVTVKTDVHGQVALASVADGLSAATFTITGGNLPTSTVNPAVGINSYMQGKAPMNNLPTFSASTLSTAKSGSGAPLAPGATDPDAAGQAVTAMSTAANWAASSSVTNARPAATLERRDAQRSAAERQGVSGVLDDWVHDFLHAIKKAAIEVTKITIDAANRAFDLATDVLNWADKAIHIVIKGIEDAAHVLHAVFNQLKTLVTDAVKWLEAEVLGTLKDANALAAQYEIWIGEALTQAGGHLQKDAAALDAWLAGKQATLIGELTNRANAYDSQTLSTMAGAKVGDAARGNRSTGRVGDSSKPSINTPHSSWLFDKIKNELTGTLVVEPVTDAETLLAEFGTAAGQALGEVAKAFDELLAFFKTVITHPQDVNTVGVKDLLAAMADLTAAVFTFVRGVAKTAMSLFAEVATIVPAMLATPISEAFGIVGKLLGLIGLGNITIGRIVTLLVAFPTVLAYKLVHGSKAAPFGLATVALTAEERNGLGYAAEDLQFCAGAVLGVWAGFDTLSAAFTATGVDGPDLFTAMDIAAPVMVTVLTTPGTNGGQPFTSPPVGADLESQMNFAAWILGLLPALSVGTAYYIHKWVEAEESAKETWEGSLLWLTSACGTGALVTASVANGLDDNPTAANYAGATLNNMANVVAPCLSGSLVKSSEGLSAVIACALTAICGLLGAVIYGIEG